MDEHQNKYPLKFFLFTCLLLICSLIFFAPNGFAKVQKGSTRDAVIAAYGEPSGVISSGNEEILSYPGGMIIVKDGVVDSINDNFDMQLKQRSEEEKFEAKQKDKGLIQHKGEWITNAEKNKIQKQQKMQQVVLKISRGGEKVNLQELLVPGKITLIDFYADWCGPCKKLSPMLEQLAHNNKDIYLRKIDIVKWGTPVANQYGLRSIPDVRVFDRKGRMVGRPSYNFNEIIAYVRQAN